MKNGKVTMSDVAKRAGVDISTVSRVLNSSFEKHKYSDKTVAKVRKAVDKLGYHPSLVARSLRTGKTMLLGMVMSDIGNPFFSEMAFHLDGIMGEYGYRLIVCNTNEDPERQEEHIVGMLAHGVDGLIVSPSGKRGLDRIENSDVPLVVIDRPLSNGFSFVGLDNVLAGKMVAQKLKAHNYRRIGVVMPDSKEDLTLQERLDGLKTGLKDEGCILSWKVCIPPTAVAGEESHRAIVNKLKKELDYPDAIVGITNVCTLNIISSLEELDLVWGESLGVVGIDDFTAASIVRPSITVVGQPIKRIAEESFALLLKQIKEDKKKLKKETVLVEPVWHCRKSLPVR